MFRESEQLAVPTIENKTGNGVQNGVQNDRIGLRLTGSDTLGLLAKPMVSTPEKGLKLSDSDPRLHPNHWEIGGKSGKIGRVSVKVSVARLPRYNSLRTLPELANGGGLE